VAKVLKDNPKKAIYSKVPWCVAVGQDGWKYVRYLKPSVGEELYDLGNDPDELKHLLDDKKHAKRLTQLREAMAAELKRTNAPAEMRK
jgi:arylsulfatase A-like enzyme